MKSLTNLILLFITVSLNAQIKFEKGYIIKNNNEKEEVYIKNMDWLINPKFIEYKTSENSEIKKIDSSQIKEFVIDNSARYIRENVEIDRSYSDFNSISTNEQPEFNNETLFLKVLIEGKAPLYRYKDKNLVRFFYKDSTSNVKQLIYKKYEVSSDKYAYNNSFRGQIAQNFNCSSITTAELKQIQYKEKQLVKVFQKINQCLGDDVQQDKAEYTPKRLDFNLSIRPRLNSSKLKLENTGQLYEFGNKSSFGIGVEAEFILPFNKKKWGIIIEPAYQYYKSDNVPNTSVKGYFANYNQEFYSVNYKNIEVPIGIRHYMFLNNSSKLFANIQYALNFNLNSSLDYNVKGKDVSSLDIKSKGNFVLGFGYNYNNKLSAELRYAMNRKITDYTYWNTKFSTLSIVLGYTLF